MDMKKVNIKHEYFLDIPFEISTTGRSPERGFYTLVVFNDGSSMWIDSKGIEITDYYWIEVLESKRNSN